MTSIRIGGVPEHFNLPWHLGMENGDFEKEGLSVSWTEFRDGTGGMCKALRQEELDGAIMLTEGIIKDICAGNPAKIVQGYIGSPLIWGIHVAANSPYQTLDDLQHERVAISRFGSGSHLMAYVNAGQQGWNMRNLNFETVINIDGAVDALQNGKAGYFMWEHFTTKPLVDKGIFRRLANCPTPWPCFVVVFRDEFLSEHPKEVERLLKTLNNITSGFKSRPNIEEVLADRYQQKPEDIKAWLKLTEWSQEQISEEELDRVQEELKELNLINDKCNKQEVLYSFDK